MQGGTEQAPGTPGEAEQAAALREAVARSLSAPDDAVLARLRQFAEAIPGMLSASTPAGEVFYFNQAWHDYLGSALGPGDTEKLMSRIHPADRAAVERTRTEALAGSAALSYEYRLRRHDGVFRWHQTRVSIVRDEQGEPLARVALTIDVDDRRRAEEGHARLAEIVESSTDAILRLDRDGRIASWNGGAARIFGYAADEALGLPVSRILAPEYKTQMELTLERVLRGINVLRLETKGLRQDGSITNISLAISPILEEGGDAVAVSWIARETDDLVRARQALEASERGLRDTIDGMPFGIYGLAADGTPLFVNRWLADYTGLDPAVLLRWWERDPGIVHEDDRGPLVTMREQAIESGTPATARYRLRAANGEYRWHEGRLAPRRGPGGAITGWVGAHFDFHQAVMADQELRASEERWRTLASAMPAVITVFSPGGQIQYLNPHAEAYFGVSVDQMLQTAWGDYTGADDPGRRWWRERMAAKEPFETEHRLRRHDGELRLHLLRMVPVQGAGGEIDRWVGVAVDIEERQALLRQVEAEQAYLAAVMEQLPAGLLVVDPAGRPTLYNRQLLEIWGIDAVPRHSREVEALLTAFHMDGHPYHHDEFPLVVALATGERVPPRVMSARRGDGSVVYMTASAGPIRDPGGRLVAGVLAIADVTARVAAEQRLAAAHAQLEQVYAGAPVGLGFLDAELRYQRVNAALAQIDGVPRERHLGRTIRELLPAWADAAENLIWRVLVTGEPLIGLEQTAPRPSDPSQAGTFVTSYYPVRADDGMLLGVGLVVEDVTAARANEAALRASEERYRRLLDTVPAIVWVTGSDGARQFNARWWDYTGLDPARFTDADAVDAAVHPADVGRLRETWAAALAAGTSWEGEYRLRDANGEYRWFFGHAIPLSNRTGAATGWLGAATEIQAVKEAQEALERANRLKDEFLGLVSHELRTPLTTILGYASALIRHGDAIDDASRRSSLADIREEAERLHRLVENMLVLSKLEGGRDFVTEPVLVQRLVPRIIAEHREKYPNRNVRYRADPATPPVDGQATYIEQVVQNLLTNAEKYSPPPLPVDIDVYDEGGFVVVRVADRGAGLTDEESEQVFEPFFRSPRTATTAAGAGLGLAVCRRLVEALGGSIFARPRFGGGTEFILALPALPDFEE